MPASDPHQTDAALATLAQLDEAANRLVAELARLRQELTAARNDCDARRSAQLREANEKLLLAALQADQIAESAVNDRDVLANRSQRDPLTGTPNRSLMLDRLESAIALAHRRGTHIAVLFLDLDLFKQISDVLGHAVGDETLQLVAQRLQSVLRDSDTVSRHGGDEFLALLTEITQPTDATLIADKMLAALAAPARIGDHLLNLSGSVGIALYPQDGTDAASLIAHADAAMYAAKRAGGGRCALHQPDTPPESAPESG